MRTERSANGRRLLTWHDDGTITKQPVGGPRSGLRYEARVLRMLERVPPPVGVPRLVAASRRAIRTAAVGGGLIGPKFPSEIDDERLDALIALASRLEDYRPPRRLRSYNPVARDAWRVGERELGVRPDLGRWRPAMSFAHGDFIPRNMLSSGDEIVLIDWEFAGRYPRGYDLATLWLVLCDTPNGRAHIETHLPDDRRTFWFAAYVTSVLHLGLAVRHPDRAPFVARRRADALHALGCWENA